MFGQLTVFILVKEHLKKTRVGVISYSKLTKSILIHFVFMLLILFILFKRQHFPAQLFKDRECWCGRDLNQLAPAR